MTSINTNTAAVSALRTLRSIGGQMEVTQRQVASGYRIEAAADNAAYWSISTTMRSDNKAMLAVADTLNFAAAKIDVASTGMEAVIDIMAEFQAKLVAAKEPGVGPSKIQAELDQLKDQVTTIAGSASFNGVNWLSTNVSDINDSDLNRVEMVSSFIRTDDGVSLGKTDFHLSEIALFNANGGGLLQADTRHLKTLGGIRNFDTYMDSDGIIHMDQSNTVRGDNAQHTFTFAGPLTFDPGDTIQFDIVVDADNPADLPGPHNPGKSTHITIDRALVDSLYPAANGVVSTYTQYATILGQALSAAGSGASGGRVYDYQGNVIPQRVAIWTNENSGLDGSSVEVRNFASDVGGGGLADVLTYGVRGSGMSLTFDPFEVYTDGDNPEGVSVSFSFSVNGAAPKTYEFDRPYVNALLGKDTGKIETAEEMVTLLKSFLDDDWPTLIIEATGTSSISVRSDTGWDRLSGLRTAIGFTGMRVSIEPLADQNFVDIDIVEHPEKLDRYIGYINVVSADIIDAAATLGALKTRIDMQSDLAADLTDVIDKGVGRLVDADMDEVSTRLKALQTQQQLANQALSIANTNSQSILSLFQQ
ncbi:flagellin [Neorhizobium sp. NPDC001467]|uniref:flagellin N-terminal helical domain-containing protein n=1 Tax=Neorhizobium sp. NPDC001467 TaxID=3390595 RepID=UPI003D05D74C